MNTCCAASASKTAPCPVNGKLYKQVKRKTIFHQVAKPWSHSLPEQAYYYCDDPKCDVVYFGEDKSLITTDEMRLDTDTRNNTLCFCFNVSIDDLKNNKELCKSFVTDQTRQSTCDCEIRNPSGKCCLKDFKKYN